MDSDRRSSDVDFDKVYCERHEPPPTNQDPMKRLEETLIDLSNRVKYLEDFVEGFKFRAEYNYEAKVKYVKQSLTKIYSELLKIVLKYLTDIDFKSKDKIELDDLIDKMYEILKYSSVRESNVAEIFKYLGFNCTEDKIITFEGDYQKLKQLMSDAMKNQFDIKVNIEHPVFEKSIISNFISTYII